MRPFTGTVAITGMNATDNPGPGVAVARSLRADPDFQGRIVGLAYDVLDPGLYSEGLLDAAFLIPYPSAGREALFARLDHVRRTVGLDVLLPTLDSELPALLGQEAELQRRGIATFLPSQASFDTRAKRNLDALRADHGIPVPVSITLTDTAPLYTLHETLSFPVVIKSLFYGATVCYTVDEAITAFHKYAAKWGLPIVAQQYIRGEELNVCAMGDGDGGTLAAVAMKKLVITESGKGWAGVSIHDHALLALARDVIEATQWRGPCEVEVLRDRDGKLWLIEVNPRFPAWCDLTPHAGQNQPMAAVRLAIGEPVVAMTSYLPGKAFIRIAIDQLVDIADLESLTVSGQTTLPHTQKRSA